MVVMKAQQSQMQVMDAEGEEVAVSGAAIEIAQTREAQEVQAQMTVAKRFPRDETQAYARAMAACKRPRLAEASQYEYKRGGQTVTGPSIRLAETLARCWGNMNHGFVELERRRGQSMVMAFAWDLETNTRQTRVFAVRHERHTRDGVTFLTDERDIYEVVANNAARRVRNCILGVLPSDIVEDAIETCDRTLANANKGMSLGDRVRKIASLFNERGATIPTLEAYLGHNLDATTEHEYSRLHKIWTAIKDGVTTVDDAFKNAREDAAKAKLAAATPPGEQPAPKKTAAQKLKEELKRAAEPPKPEAPPTAPKPSTEQAHHADSDPPYVAPEREPGSDDGDDDEQPITS